MSQSYSQRIRKLVLIKKISNFTFIKTINHEKTKSLMQLLVLQMELHKTLVQDY